MANSVEKLIRTLYPETVALRRDLHRHPEIGFREQRTTGKIGEFLRGHGLTDIRQPLETGLIADLVSVPDEPFIALRADIDALPLADEKTVSYRSQNAGRCHACGHDVHTAIMCGVAAAWQRITEKPPLNVRFIFQPAEEPIPSGAPRMIEAGALRKVDAMLGLHVDPELPLGSIDLTDGWVNAQSIRLDWTIEGPGGHSARPRLTADPIRAATALMRRAYELAEQRWNHPDYPAVLAFTEINSGEGYNIIPRRAHFTATLRLTDGERREPIMREIEELNREIEKQSHAAVHFRYLAGSPPVWNDARLVERIRTVAQDKDVWEIRSGKRSMGGDDFGWYAQQVPSIMIRLGINTGATTPALHTGLFDVPEEVIPIGIRFFLTVLLHWNG